MSLADELFTRWAPVLSGIELKTGSKGRFEVSLDGKLVFSKAELGRFPEAGEIVAVFERRLGRPLAWRKGTH